MSHLRRLTMFHLHPILIRVLITVSVLTAFVLSAGAPTGYGG